MNRFLGSVELFVLWLVVSSCICLMLMSLKPPTGKDEGDWAAISLLTSIAVGIVSGAFRVWVFLN